MKPYFILCLLVVSVAIASCSHQKKISTEYKNLDTLVVVASGGLNVYQGSRPRYWDITHTGATLSFNLKAKEAYGEAVIKLHPYAYATDSIWLDAKSMDVHEVKLMKGVAAFSLSFKVDDNKLKIKLPKLYYTKDTIEISIKYTAKPYNESTGGSKAITDDRGLYFINTDNKVKGKPMQIWTQGETESNSHWLPTIDQPNERMTTQLNFIVPDSFVTLSNGYLVESKKFNSNLRIDSWKMDKPIQTYAIMFAIGNYTIVSDTSWKDKEINYYVEPEFAPYAKLMFQHTPEMMEYFSTITGVDYPWNKYSQIVVRDYVSGAMENTTASLFGEFMNQNEREHADNDFENIVSHELFHQWFGDYVTAESWSNLTLNESFANYGEQLWRKYKYGSISVDELSYTDLGKYVVATEYDDPSLLRYYYNSREDMFDRVSYEKGGAVLKYLHGLIGDTAFYKAMNIYLTKNALQPAEVAQWRMAVEEATGLDWNLFFNQWYLRSGHPVLKATFEDDSTNKQLRVVVQQVQEDSSKYVLSLKTKVIYGNDISMEDWNINSRKQEFTYPYKNGTKPLIIPDATHWLVGVMRETKPMTDWLHQFQISTNDYISKRRAIASAFMTTSDSVSQQIFHLALKDTIPQIRAYALSLLERLPSKHKWGKDFTDELMYLATNEPSNKVKASVFDVVGSWKLNGFQKVLLSGLESSSYEVAGAALGAFQLINKDTAYKIAKSFVHQDTKGDLRAAVWSVIASKGAEEDIAIFQAQAQKVYGSSKLNLASYLYSYSIAVKQDVVFESCMALLTDIAHDEQIKTYRYTVGALVFTAKKYYQNIQDDKDNIKAASAKARVEMASKFMKQIIEEESDEQNRKRYTNYE